MPAARNEPLPQRLRSTWLAVAFLLVSFLVALALLGTRNIYDDEIVTADLLPLPAAQIVSFINQTDVHPPGMYVLAHLGYKVIPSARWVTLFPLLCLYGGLGVFVLAVAPLFHQRQTLYTFLLLSALHPQLLMWGNSIRWYPWWTGIALVAVVIALNPGRSLDRTFSYGRGAMLGLLLGALFYLNYITIIFSLALGVGMVVRYGWRVWRPLLVTAAVGLALVAPQLHAFLTVHLRGSGGQRSNLGLSGVRLIQSLLCSEAFLPWHPLALLAAALWFGLAIVGALAAARFVRTRRLASWNDRERALAAILTLSFALLTLVAVTGLGGKPRNGLILVPLLAPAMALAVASVRSRNVRLAAFAFLAIWSGWGAFHLIGRQGLMKSGMNNRPNEVLRFIESTRGEACSVVVTYDPVLSFYLVQSHLPRQRVLTLSQISLYRDAAPFDPNACTGAKLYVVQSYLGGFAGYGVILPAQLRVAAGFIQGKTAVDKFSYDPDASLKRRLKFIGGSEDLPDFRYMVGWGTMAPDKIEQLQAALPYLTIADGRSTAKRE